jgi:hypothetical protein
MHRHAKKVKVVLVISIVFFITPFSSLHQGGVRLRDGLKLVNSEGIILDKYKNVH